MGAGLLSLGVSLWQMSRPELVGVYDSGVYLAASIRLISGALPYRDFVFVQPPGIVMLLSPAGVVSRIFGSHDGLIVARVMTSFVSALNVSLLCLLVRHRGRAPMLIAGLGLAFIPIASDISSALFLEQYVVFFVLLGALAVFSPWASRSRMATRPLVLGGALFGFAGLVKIWAFFPFLAMVICLAVAHRRRVLVFVGAAVATFSAIALPFILAAPDNFLHEVLIAQLTRKPYVGDNVGVLMRLVGMTGLALTQFAPSAFGALVIFLALICLVALAYTRRVSPNTTDLFILLAAAFAMWGILAGPVFYPHYAAFVVPFLVALVAISIGRVRESTGPLTYGLRMSRSIRTFVWRALAAGFVALLVGLIMWTTIFYSSVGGESSNYASLNKIPRFIPADACVIYDNVGYGILENRFFSSDPSCPDVVDPIGTRLMWGTEVSTPARGLIRQWRGYFEAAQYVVLDNPEFSSIPTNAYLLSWFHRNYHLLYDGDYLQIYQRLSFVVASLRPWSELGHSHLVRVTSHKIGLALCDIANNCSESRLRRGTPEVSVSGRLRTAR